MKQYSIQILNTDLKFQQIAIKNTIVIVSNNVIQPERRVNQWKKCLVKSYLSFAFCIISAMLSLALRVG